MAAVIGPTRSKPGSRHALPPGTMCDDHPYTPAVVRLQGETDSFGAELNDLCADCVALMAIAEPSDTSGICDWCSSHSETRAKHRHHEEGPGGAVYDVCPGCIKEESASLSAEIAEMGEQIDSPDDDDIYDDVPFSDDD